MNPFEKYALELADINFKYGLEESERHRRLHEALICQRKMAPCERKRERAKKGRVR